MNRLLEYLYRSFYGLSHKVNGEDAFHNCYACLALTFFQMIIFCDIAIALYILTGVSIVSDNLIEKKIVPLSILMGVYFINYGYFTIGERYKKLVKDISKEDIDKSYRVSMKYILASASVLLFLTIIAFKLKWG